MIVWQRVILPVCFETPNLNMMTKMDVFGRQFAKGLPASGEGPPLLTVDERALLAALCGVVIPCDESGPGAQEAGVAEALAAKIASQPQLQGMYSRGLRSFDAWAQHLHRRAFAKLPYDQQVQIVTQVDEIARDWSRSLSFSNKVFRKLRTIMQKRRGLSDAVELFPRLVRDITEIFYTSPTAWQWLGYQGPPMPKGY